jgi:hypothetical protein
MKRNRVIDAHVTATRRNRNNLKSLTRAGGKKTLTTPEKNTFKIDHAKRLQE